MDLNLTPSEQKFRDELRAWLTANVPEEWAGGGTGSEDRAEYIEYLRAWQRKLYDGGWAGISWPKEYGGRGATLIEQAIFQEELARADAPQLIGTIGLSLVGPTIIAVGTEEQKERYLPKILSGEEIWCQGFSEPNAGSDLAALGTKAVRDGDDFRRQRPEDLDELRADRRLVSAARAHRLGGAEAQGASPACSRTCTPRASRCGR